MPYYIVTQEIADRFERKRADLTHLRGHEKIAIRATTPYDTRQAARAVCVSGESVIYMATPDERQVWFDRENEKFNNGTYLRVPWFNELEYSRLGDIVTHFAHMALDASDMIAYTKTEEHGVQDRQTRIRPGRYLKTYWPDMADEEVNRWSSLCCASAFELRLATTISDVRAVYRNGPRSCMGGPASHTDPYWTEYDLDGLMPCEVYAESPDLAVAYLGTLDKPTARAVVWPEEKRFTRCYGNIDMLNAVLVRAGYHKTPELDGARIRRVRLEDGRSLLPYIDGSSYVHLRPNDADHIYIGDRRHSTHERFPAHQTHGTLEPAPDDETENCSNCGDAFASDDLCDGLCGYCQDHTFSCDSCGGRYDDVDSRSTLGGIYCEDCYRERITECRSCGCEFAEEDFSRTDRRSRSNNNQTELCARCARNYAICTEHDEVYCVDDGCEECDADRKRDDDAPTTTPARADGETEEDTTTTQPVLTGFEQYAYTDGFIVEHRTRIRGDAWRIITDPRGSGPAHVALLADAVTIYHRMTTHYPPDTPDGHYYRIVRMPDRVVVLNNELTPNPSSIGDANVCPF